jgi:hypothetical protein
MRSEQRNRSARFYIVVLQIFPPREAFDLRRRRRSPVGKRRRMACLLAPLVVVTGGHREIEF